MLLEVPANSIMERYFRYRPSWWIGGLTVLWGKLSNMHLGRSLSWKKGTCMTLHGVVHNYSGLLAVRLALGIPEAGFFPG